MIRITRSIVIDEDELSETFVRASGPGGQNVNKVASCVQLRFNAAASPALSDDVRARLATLAGRRLTNDGVLVINADRFRTQERNRADARERLIDLLQRAAVAPTVRRATRPTLASKRERVESKKRRSDVKRHRSVRPESD
ncbi:MAG: arfB [Hyphomicrobiales bacterium]|nr:arfB [Hyphomicrobiales bacterium]